MSAWIARWCLLVGLTAVTGCESMRPAAAPAPERAPPRVAATSPAAPTPTIDVLRASAAQPPAPVEDDPLALVARCLERRDHAGAAVHLEDYVRQHPDQPMFRAQLAELYLRADRPADAKFHFERFVADAQAGPATLRVHLVHCHTKLMEIGLRTGDRFAELFHRGVGLLLLVKEQDGTSEKDQAFCEEVLCKAIRALSEAKELKPGDPRVRAYLAEAHDRTGNRRGADAERAAARSGVVAGELTAAERRALPLAE